MQLTAREDIEAPLDKVFAALSDFESVERQALRRGIEVQRTSDGAASQDTAEQLGQNPSQDPRHAPRQVPCQGMTWDVGFAFRGKKRRATITLTTYAPPESMTFESISGGLTVDMVVDVVALSRTRTRINVRTELKPQTLSARLLVQSLKIAKGGIESRFRNRMKGLGQDLEARLR